MSSCFPACCRALLLLLSAALFAACATPPEPALQPQPAPEEEAVTEPETVVQSVDLAEVRARELDEKRITIAAVGDMMLGTDYPNNHLPDDDGAGFLRHVTPILAAADIAFGNLEGVLLDGGEPAKQCSNPNACYLFRSPTRYAKYLADAGFDVMSLANNHARDFGEEGRLSSMRALAALGIHHSGLEGDFASFTLNGVKIALLAYAVTKNSNMMLDYEFARETVAAHAATHDVVIVSFHGGAEGQDVTRLPFAEEEYFGEPRGDVVKFARMMVDAGADLLLGHGPHVVRAIENFEDRLIAYSLGNFATYYGISVAGIKGIAPILEVTVDGHGRFIEGKIHSTIQLRPDGPSIDSRQRALTLMRDLSMSDFGSPGVAFDEDGRIRPAPRIPTTPFITIN